jgi:membrane-associated phospholipid phosphatase
VESHTNIQVTPPHPNPLPEGEGPGGGVRLLRIALWLIAIVIAMLLDAHVANFVHDRGIDAFLHTHAGVRQTLKAPGEYWFTAVVALVAGWIHREHLNAAIFVILATAISGVNGAIKWIVGRTRPFKLHDNLAEPFSLQPFRGGIPGAFDAKNLCFPSGHAALAFATAAALAILWPRFRWAFYALATVVAMERFAENAHWLSDTVAAAALGVAGVHLIRWAWWDRRTKRQQRGLEVRLTDG